ncbi:hypothetical protein AZE42_03690 [Rhizopogon vesiculosus]|uniref:Uncharacterized protein n=1 Tax=Rhizopogon vesiculosus TaxID=180088 RepID=A0A1J8Q2H9_9AGAM|nr:hypothetical protein AZE42_03690 [Rhizopogon vesiculosus]
MQYSLLKISDFTPATRIVASAWNSLRESGAILGIAVENSSCLCAQVRSAEAPQTITEAYFLGPKEGWKTRVF